MAACEFEEKEFEAPLYNQLATQQNHVWSPGQVLEGKLGMDYALMCNDPYIWSLQGLSAAPPGVLLHHLSHHFPGVKRPLPNFSLNLFIQAKRSQPRSKLNKALKQHGISSPYWRFGTTKHQQDRLGHLSNILGSDALVCYAAPAFHRLTQLNAHTVSGSIVGNTSFPKATMLAAPHKAWNFSLPGMVGLANTEPNYYEEPPLEDQIRSLVLERANRLEQDASAALSILANRVRESGVRELDDGGSRAAVFSMRAARIDAAYGTLADDFPEASLARDFLHVSNYAATFSMLWLTLGRDSE